MKKKGQITLFIIIGIAILIVLFVGIWLASVKFEFDEEQAVDITPDGFKIYVEQCMKDVSKSGIILAGSQGGYVDIPDYISRNPATYLKLGNAILPMWYYSGELRIPSIDTIEESISFYIQDNVETCFNDFEPFKNKYSIEVKSKPLVDTIIGDEDVTVKMNYDVLLQTSLNETDEYDSFVVAVPIRMKRAYELAKQIMISENKEMFFEELAIDFLAMNPKIPITGMDFSCQQKTWLVSDIKQEFKDMIFYNMFKSRFKNTNYLPFEKDVSVYDEFSGFDAFSISEGASIPDDRPSDLYEYFNMFFDIGETDYTDLKASVEYLPSQDVVLRANPSTRGVMRSNNYKSKDSILNIFCAQFHHFTYDVSYPLRISVFDETAFYGEGFKFNYALPVMVKSNRPDRRDNGQYNFDSPIQYVNPCEPSDKEIDIQVLGISEGYYNVPLKDVNISYDCVIDGCDIGTTKATNGLYQLKTYLPNACSNGYLTAFKDGYLPAKQQHLGEDYVVIKMKKVEDFKIKILKASKDSYDSLSELSTELSEAAFISLYSNDDGSSFMGLYRPGDDDLIAELVVQDANYTVDITLMNEDNDGMLGGYKGNLTYDFTETLGKRELVFKVVEYKPRPITQSAKIEMMMFVNDDAEYKNALVPEFR